MIHAGDEQGVRMLLYNYPVSLLKNAIYNTGQWNYGISRERLMKLTCSLMNKPPPHKCSIREGNHLLLLQGTQNLSTVGRVAPRGFHTVNTD